MMSFFTKLQHSETTEMLMKDNKAFALLAAIAYRARRSDGWVQTKKGTPVFLKIGQALIGDYQNYGLTEKEYRCAKTRLSKCKLASFLGRTDGTIATLENKEVFDISMKSRADKGRTQGD
jgi:hypothetical protein